VAQAPQRRVARRGGDEMGRPWVHDRRIDLRRQLTGRGG
jgi:hypothetical protein